MTDQLQGTLASAYELIEADRLDEARSVLKPILAENIDNADAWWLYAHAVDDPETARTALNNVLRIDPDYPGATALMSTLEHAYPVGTPAAIAEPDPFEVTTTASFDLADDLEPGDDDLDLEPELTFEDTADNMAPVQAEPSSRRPNWLLILILLLLIIVIIVLLVLPGGGGGDQQQPALTPTPDVVPTVDSQSQIAPTIESVVSAEEAAAAALVEEALADDTALPGSARVGITPLGPTMLVSVCTTAGDEMRVALDTSMRDIAGTADQMTGVADAVGVRLVDCATEMTLRVIGVPAATAAQFAAGEIDLDTYQGSWRALP